MTAAVLHSPGDIRIENVARPQLSSSRDVLIGVEACGVCGSDIGRMMVKGAHAMPLVCGHEFSGRVIDAGDDVTGLNIGDLITVPPLITSDPAGTAHTPKSCSLPHRTFSRSPMVSTPSPLR